MHEAQLITTPILVNKTCEIGVFLNYSVSI